MYKFLCENKYLFYWDKCPTMQLLSGVVSPFLVLKKLPNYFMKWFYSLHSHQKYMSESLSVMLIRICCFHYFHLSHPDRCVVISYLVLICISLMANDTSDVYFPSVYLLQRNVCACLLPTFKKYEVIS